MTLTLELSPDVERALEAEAARRGVSPPVVAGEVLSEWAQERNGQSTLTQSALTPRQQAALRGYGLLAGRARTVDDFLRERRAEAEREMQATATRLERLKAR